MSDPLFLSTFPLLFSFKLFAFFFYSFELSTVFSFKFYDNLMGMPVFYTPFLLFLSWLFIYIFRVINFTLISVKIQIIIIF